MAEDMLNTLRAAAWFDIAESGADAFKSAALAEGNFNGFSIWQGVAFVVHELHELVIQRNIGGSKVWRALPEHVLAQFINATQNAYSDALADPKSLPLVEVAVWDYLVQVLSMLNDTNDIEAALDFAVEMADFH